ncbi:MAG: DUF448 domain-containing protein [Desulfofustis sp.]|nr:DUF448 domain-containing protein [Desulfofustis sp.]
MKPKGSPRKIADTRAMGFGPIRTCLACKARLPKSELTRYVWRSGSAVVDERHRLEGRGAYHCMNDRCRQQFHANRKRLGRAFRLT